MVTRYPITMPDVVERSRALALTLLPSLEARAAILTGAPLAGLGTPTSDVDVHVVVADPPERPSRQFAVEDRRVDVRYWTAEQLNERIGLCSRYRFNEDDRDQLDQVSRYIIEPVVRFAMAEILLDDGTLTELRSGLAARENELVKVIAGVMAVEVENHVEDAQGFAETAAACPAQYVSRQALLSAAEAFLASRGDIYMGQKWVWKRWERTIGDRLGPEVSDLVVGSGGGQDLPSSMRKLWLAQDLLLLASIEQQYPLVPRLRAGAPRRTPFATPTPATTGILVRRTGRKTVRLSRQGALLWGVSHGRSRDEAVVLTQQLLTDTGTDVSADSVRDYYDDLCAFGLVEVTGAADT